ncbi:hypothetical protein JCM10212_002645 [Sporobolomyces blumeae]
MAKFVTREIEIPDDPDDDGDEFGAIPASRNQPPGTRRAPSSHSGRSGRSGGSGNTGKGLGEAATPPLPALPDALLDALSRDPGPANPSSLGASTTSRPAATAPVSRSSFSLNRASAFFDPDASKTTVAHSPALPSLPPHSPLSVAYPDGPAPSRVRQDSLPQGFSIGRTSAPASPALSRSNSRPLDGFDGSRDAHLPSNPTPPLDHALQNSNVSTKKSMFRSLPFGRSKASLGPSPNSSTPPSPELRRYDSLAGSSSPLWTEVPGEATPSAPSTARLTPTTTDSPTTTTTDARLSPSVPTLERRPSRQQLATAGFAQRMSQSARDADRWLFEAQAAGLGIGAGHVVASTSGSGGHDSRRGSDVGLEDDEVEREEDEEQDARSGWAGRGERYTRDLQRTRATDTDYEDDAVEGEGEGESISIDDDGESVVEGETEPRDQLVAVLGAGSPERPFHDALQSPEAARTPTFPPSTPPALPSGSGSRHLSPVSPTETIAGRVALPPKRTDSFRPPPPQPDWTSSDLPPRRDGKLSLPIYSDAPLGSAFDEVPKRRNRSDGDPLDAEGQAELARRIRGIGIDDQSSEDPGTLADFVVAVVGPRNVGKSSVVKKGLKPRSSEIPVVIQEDEAGNRVTTVTTSFTIGGVRRTIEILEIDMHLLRYNDEGVIWPDGLPQCEGAMLCYDSTDPDALSSLSVLLKAFWTRGSDVPLIVLACKAVPPDLGKNATDPLQASKVCNVYGAGIVTLDGGLDDPSRKTKESFKYIIRQIMENRGEMTRPLSSTASHSPTEERYGSLHQYATTSRSPFTGGSSSDTSPAFSDGQHRLHDQSPRFPPRNDSVGLGLPVVRETPLDSPQQHEISSGSLPPPVPPFSSAAPEEPLSPRSQAPTYTSDAPTYRTEGQAYLEEQFAQQVHGGEGPSGELAPGDIFDNRGSSGKTAALDLYFSRDDMIDKFLYASVTGNDEAYVTLFLITYRRFARPYDVLEKLVERFEFVARKLKSDPLLSRFAQMKICGVLSIWMQNYPGDFSSPSTYGILAPFLQSLLPSGATWVAHYALELIPLLGPIAAQSDPDLSWALPDRAVDSSPMLQASSSTGKQVAEPVEQPARRPSIAPSYDSANSQNLGSQGTNLSIPGSTPQTTENSPVPSNSLSPRPQSEASTLDTEDSGEHSQGMSGSNPSLRPRGGPGAVALIEISNMVMEMREEEVAQQITRLAWEMFGGMTPRDLLRHVLAPRDPGNPRVALRDSETNVMRSIAFVNYLANWTATLVLVQGKIKQRARILEKMLLIALALREKENFDSLMGILAGINSQPIFRLTETMELVTNKLDGDPKTQPRRPELVEAEKIRLPKKLRSLNRLMAATKSFSAYRLALANSGMNMIPYLGVHLQDITVVNEIKSDLRDGKVNWSKFSQMGRSAAIVLDCARIAPSLPIDKLVERAVLNVDVLDEERQYALSYQHQPRQSDRPSGARSRLRDLAKSTFATSS